MVLFAINIRFIFLSLVIGLIPAYSSASIDISVDVTGTDRGASSAASKVFVERIELSFPNNRASQTVNLNSKKLYARAKFKYLGNGPLIVRWKVDGRVISQSSEILTFGKEVEIRSDKNKTFLPTYQRGSHVVTLELRNSSGLIDVTVPTIKYFVADGVAGLETDTPLRLMYPSAAQVDPAKVYFRWQGQSLFKAYSIEVQRIASKTVTAATLIKAISDIDVYSPTDKTRSEFVAADYRWRVKGIYQGKKLKPLTSKWANFSVSNDALSGGLFIRQISAETSISDTGLSAQSLQIKRQIINNSQRLISPQHVVSQGNITAGSGYQLNIELQNSGFIDANNAAVEVHDHSGLIGRYPVTAAVNNNVSVLISLDADSNNQISYENLNIILLNNNHVIDEGAINLTISPELRLDALDFDEINTRLDEMVAIANPCGSTSPAHNLAFSRMISARSLQSTQSVLDTGSFTFVKNQNIEFTAYLKDKGLGNWFASSRNNCGVSPLSSFDRRALNDEIDDLLALVQQCYSEHTGNNPDKSCKNQINALSAAQVQRNQDDIYNGNAFHLQFIAHPLDQYGQLSGEPIEIGQVTVNKNNDGLVKSPFWKIPESGQYKITLNDISEPVDLFATNINGLPKYIHAGGFVLELDQVHLSSDITNMNPRQASINGVAYTHWAGDSSQQRLLLDLDNVSVTMQANPLHGVLSGGELNLKENQSITLALKDVSMQLNQLQLNISGAIADLAYKMPGYNPSMFSNITSYSFTKGGKGEVIQNSIPNNGNIKFQQLKIFNGGEFVARYDFDNSWADTRLNNDDLALRLKGSTLVIDASKHFSFTDYTSEEEFTGMGFYNALVRLKVNNSNGLFSLVDAEHGFIYGRANWLNYSENNVSGENIEVISAVNVADFFNQAVATEFELLQPFGFKLKITGGVFSLEDSQIGGLDLSGSVNLPGSNDSDENALSHVISNHEFVFQHLHRRASATGVNLFSTELVDDSSINFSVGVFDYQPENITLYIGEEDRPAYHSLNNPALDQLEQWEHEALTHWQESISNVLTERAGLLMSNGRFGKSWQVIASNEDTLDGFHRGAFLVNSQGFTGQWIDAGDTRHYQSNGFDSKVTASWIKFEGSSLVDSYVKGQLIVPYPVDQKFAFSGKLDQEAGFNIPENALQMPSENNWDLSYWKARLHVPEDETTEILTPTYNAITRSELPVVAPSHLYFDSDNQRIKIQGLGLSLLVSDESGGEEFTAIESDIPFNIDTYILPDGQLTETYITPNANIQFIGQAFEPDSHDAIQFLPYLGNHQAPADDVAVTSQPLIEIQGDISFSVFGPRTVTIHHTASGAKVPEISRSPNIDEYYGEGDAIRVNAQLKFINTYARSAEGVASQVSQSTGETSENLQAFKAFVGTADLVMMNAVSIKGLAEAGIHQQSVLQRNDDNNGIYVPVAGGEQVAYERLGLGAGADIVKATLAGVRGLETATKLGGAAVSAVAGVDGTGQQVVDLGVDAVNFIESVAVAVAVTGGTAGLGAEEIRHAIDNGLATTDSAIKLLKIICDQQPGCLEDTSLQLDVASLFVRIAGGVSHFEQLTAEEIASISLQMMDTGIPLLRGIPVGQVADVPVNDIKDASLSAAHMVVGAARTLVDNNGRIAFADFLKISRRAVHMASDIRHINGLVPAGDEQKILDLSISLANESIDMVDAFNNSGGINSVKLNGLTNQMIKLMCSQSENINPLFHKAGLAQANDQFIKPILSFSSQVLEKVETEGLPQNEQQAVSTFLINLLQSLSEGTGSIEGCETSQMQAMPAVQAMLKIAAHSLKPMKGALNNEGKQIAWALDGVSLSIDAVNEFSQQLNGNSFAEAQQIKTLLNNLSSTFNNLQTDLSENQNNADKGRTILRLAKGIPEAFQDLVSTGSPQAAELMDIYIALMRELEILISNAENISANELEGIDLFALPLALINETQDLSMLNQCQKYALSNLTNIISMSREVAKDSPSLSQIVSYSRSIHNNIKACDQTGFSRNPELEKLMVLLELSASMLNNNQQTALLVKNSLPQLLPLFVDGSVRMLESVQAFIMALPIIDFTQDDLTPVLDDTLIKLLNEAESRSSSSTTKNAIRKARSIISHADFNIIGLTLTRDDTGNVTSMKQIRADGSERFYDFSLGWFKQIYPEGHPDYTGGVDELYSAGSLSYENLSAADKLDMFSENWNAEYANGDIHIRKYKDALGNYIIADNTNGADFVFITDAVSYGATTPERLIQVNGLPDVNTLASDINIESIWRASFYLPDNDSDCPFAGGCIVKFQNSLTYLTIHSVVNSSNLVVYTDSEENMVGSLDEIRPEGQLMLFNGRIISTQNNWNPLWQVNYRNDGVISIKKSDSIEVLNLGDANLIDSISEIINLVTSANNFVYRRVITGNDIWDYRPMENRAIHSFGNGQWAVYHMDSVLADGIAVPAPEQILPMSELSLQFEGDANGLTENSNLPGVAENMLVDGDIQIPSENPGDVIVITLSGTGAGSVTVGGVPLDIVADNSAASSEPDGMGSRPLQDDGSYIVNGSNGSSSHYIGSNKDNMKIIRSTSASGIRTVDITFCSNPSLSLAMCAGGDESYSANYLVSSNYEIFYLPVRPVITPASGINQAIKHQLWLDVFELERQLKINPSEELLNRLAMLIDNAEAQGLPADELLAQHKHIAATAIKKLIMLQFEYYENNVSNLQTQQGWETNPDSSPAHKIKQLIERGESSGLAISIHANSFKQRFYEMQVLNYRSQLHQLMALNLSASDTSSIEKFKTHISALGDATITMSALGDNEILSTLSEYVCGKLEQVENDIIQPLVSDTNRVVFKSDIKFALDVMAYSDEYGCENVDFIAEVSSLTDRLLVGSESDSLSLQVSSVMLEKMILNQNPETGDYNHSGGLSSDDLIRFYMDKAWHGSNVENLNPPEANQYSLWAQQIQVLDRAIELIKSERIRRSNNGLTVYFYESSVEDLKTSMVNKLKLAWEAEWNRLFTQFRNNKTNKLDDLKGLAAHYELTAQLNTVLKLTLSKDLIEVDSQQYLRSKANGSWNSPLNQMKDQQQAWIDEIWLTNNTVDVNKQNLHQQDDVIAFLKNTFPEDRLAGIKVSEKILMERLNQEMDNLEVAIARPDIDDILDDVLKPVTDIDKLLSKLQIDSLRQRMDERVQTLLDQAVERVRTSSNDVLNLEIQKIIAIQTKHNGNINGIVNNQNIMSVLANACDTAQQAMISQSTVDDLSHIQRFINVANMQESLGVESDQACSLSEAAEVMGRLLQEAFAELVRTQDINQVVPYLNLAEHAVALGNETDIGMAEIGVIIDRHRLQILSCVDTKNCTINNIKDYIKAAAQAQSLGVVDINLGADIDSMTSSSPDTMPGSIQRESDLPDLAQLVKSDASGSNGRSIASNILLSLGASLDLTNAQARKSINSIIARLKSLGSLTIPASFNKPVQINDPLFNAADDLQLKFDTWLEQATQQLADALNEDPGILVTDAVDGNASTIEGLGFTDEEIENILLPALNGNPGDDRIEPGNKYRLAATALEEINDLDGTAFLNLSYRILKNIPDPDITAEGDYRLAGIAQLTTFIFARSGEFVVSAGQVLSEDDIKDLPAANVLFTLLNLPAQQDPLQALATTIETQLISPLINGENASMSCAQGVGPCVLSSGLQIVAISLDSLIVTAQESDLENSDNGTANKQQKLIVYLNQLATKLSAVSNDGSAEAFWFSLGGEGLGISLMMFEQNIDLEKKLALRGLQLANKLFTHSQVDQFVSGLVQPVPMAFYFVRDSSVFLQQQLSENNDQNLPVAMARLVQGAVVDTMQSIDPALASFGNELMGWQLDFADANWELISAGTIEANEWMAALVSDKGVASLNCRVNASTNLSIPPALSLSPFVAAQSLINNRALLGRTENSPKLLADLSADLSNLWFAKIENSHCDNVSVPVITAENDQPTAKLLRQLGSIDTSKGADLAAVQVVGNFGIGAINMLLPETSLSNVMNLVWNGSTEKNGVMGSGVNSFIVLGMQGNSLTPEQALSVVSGVSVTASEIVESLTSANDPTAVFMRILTGNVKQADMLPPDRMLGSGQAYAIPNSILAILGQVRKVVKPLPSPDAYASDNTWGYLKTVPFMNWNNSSAQLSDAGHYAEDMNEMIGMASGFNAAGAANQGTEVVQKVMIAGADIARLGITGIAPLIDPDPNNHQAVAAIQQRALFDTLAGDTPGFSGVSGGLQREWFIENPSQPGDLTLEMYGQLVFPFFGRHVGMMQLITQGDTAVLDFQSANATEAIGDFVGGLTGGVHAQFSVDDHGALGLAYQGNTKLEILSNTIAEGAASGFIRDFNVPGSENLTPLQYAKKQAETIDILQCASLETQIVPFPLSLTGVGATANIGGFMEKTDLGATFGSRVGLSGNLNFPVITSLLGITLDGDITSAYGGSLNPVTGQVELSNQTCVNPDISLTVFGQSFSLTGVNAEVASFIEGDLTTLNPAAGIKMKVSLNSAVVTAIKTNLGCFNESFEPFKLLGDFVSDPTGTLTEQGICTVLDAASTASMWVVLRNEFPAKAQMILGFGELPAKQRNTVEPFFIANYSIGNNGNITPGLIEISKQAGDWGGWPGSKNINICNKQMCNLSQFEALQ